MKTFIVTGTAGFIAARTVELLLDQGHHVIGLDNLSDAYDIRLKLWRLERLRRHPNFVYHPIDICDGATLRSFELGLTAVDAVLHLAGRAGIRASVEHPALYVQTNIQGTLNLLELCRMHGVPKFVFASSSSLYGNQTKGPFSEEADTSHLLSPYAVSKKAAEEICYTYHYLHGIDVTVFRYFTVFGPAGRPDMAPFRFVHWVSEGHPVRIYGDGKQKRDFTYVDDIARGTLAGLRSVGYAIFNLGSDTPIQLLDLLAEVEALVGLKAQVQFHPTNPADVLMTWAKIDKARAVLDWQPKFKIQDGLRKLVEWYKAERNWASTIRVF